MSDEKNETIEDFLGQMAEYIKSTFPKAPAEEKKDPSTPPAPETKKDPEPKVEKKKHFWFGDVD